MTRPRLAQDRAGFVSPGSLFRRAKRLEEQYAKRLRQVARHVADLLSGFAPTDHAGFSAAQAALRRYADALDPWAQQVGERMVAEVAAADDKAWRKIAKGLGRNLRQEVQSAPTGVAMREAMQRQVGLIKSLPLEAAERVHAIVIEGMSQGRRAEDIAREIAATGQVTKSRANLIARTEVSRAATELTAARAKSVGSEQFIWRTAGDSDVRKTHRALNGKVFAWNDPPECDPGHRALPGAIWNCRCWAEPIIPD